MSDFKLCAIVPYYNHPNTLPYVVAALRNAKIAVIIVDDASDRKAADVADQLRAQATETATGGIEVVRHRNNQGKGGAVISGLQAAGKKGFTHAIQVDADGQHDMESILRFVEISRGHPRALVLGYPVYDSSVPASRYYPRYLTHIWVWINCLSLKVKDSMCGFRVYPVTSTMAVIENGKRFIAQRMGFDTEVCVRVAWSGIDIINEPVQVSYPEGGISHFRPFQDNAEISLMHARCFLGMLARSPQLLLKKFRGQS